MPLCRCIYSKISWPQAHGPYTGFTGSLWSVSAGPVTCSPWRGEGGGGPWEGVSLGLFWRSRIPDATLVFIFLFSVALATITHLPGCPGAPPGYLFATLLSISFSTLLLFLLPWDLAEAGDLLFSRCFFSSVCLHSLSLLGHIFLNDRQCRPPSRCFLRFCRFPRSPGRAAQGPGTVLWADSG